VGSGTRNASGQGEHRRVGRGVRGMWAAASLGACALQKGGM
jgi:hypothetical protein